MAMISEGSTADEITINDASFIYKSAAAHLKVKLTLGYSSHPLPADTVGSSGNFPTVTDAGDRCVL